MPKVVIFSGAGISAESGISTFRDADGLWENHKIEEVCYYPTWKHNKALVYDFYNKRRQQLKDVEPNHIHYMLAELQNRFNAIHITQNVDDLSERANGKSIIHVHGELTKMMCDSCGHTWEVYYNSVSLGDACPKCCNVDNIKPFVVFFGEQAPEYKKMYAIIESLKQEDIILVIGTSNSVVDIYGMIKNKKCHKILCNLEKSNHKTERQFKYKFFGKGTEHIDEICFLIENLINS